MLGIRMILKNVSQNITLEKLQGIQAEDCPSFDTILPLAKSLPAIALATAGSDLREIIAIF